VLDASVFIGAHRTYYSFDFCPGFWICLLLHFHGGTLWSIDKVRDELLDMSKSKDVKPDALYKWTKAAPRELFVPSSERPVVTAYKEIMAWVQNEPQFMSAAVSEFAAEADGWLIAYAYVRGAVVVTQEVLAPDVRKRVPIPNVCQQFNVDYLNTFEMLRQLGVQFDLRPTT
jgi:hypothetical protein